MLNQEWLLFIAQIPATPSSIRVRVWRKLRDAGATSLQNGVWVLPRNNDNVLVLELLQGYIKQNNASGQILTVNGLNQTENDNIIERFRADRDQEYSEFLEQCTVLVNELEKETRNQKFNFAELEENEQNYQRLRKWINKIQKRDFLTTDKNLEAISTLQGCRDRLQTFAHMVYTQEGVNNIMNAELLSEDRDTSDEEENDDIE